MFLPLLGCIFLVFATVNGMCGISHNVKKYEEHNQNRILGGIESDTSDWPFLVKLMIIDPVANTGGGCTGSIIGKRWILSAAHCFEGPHIKAFVQTSDKKKHLVQAIYNHEKFIYGDFDVLKDITLLKLQKPLEFSPHVSPVCLSKNINANKNETVVAAGWGCLFIKNTRKGAQRLNDELLTHEMKCEGDDILREAHFQIQDMIEYCGEEIEDNNKVCAGAEGKGTTQGDSGGPLLAIRNHRWVQYGITSYSAMMPVAGNDKIYKDLGIYTRVSAFCKWIEHKTFGEVTCQ